mgnify:FL=1
MKGGDTDADDTIVICSECGENPAVKGSDLCTICLREARRQEMQTSVSEPITDPDQLVLGGVALDEMEVPLPSENDIPESELDEIDKELSNGEDDDDDMDDDIEDEIDGDEEDRNPRSERSLGK